MTDPANRDRENWVRARAYGDGQFLLEKLYSRIASDVREADKLPESMTPGRAFSCELDPEDVAPLSDSLDPERASRFSVDCDDGYEVRRLIFWAKRDCVGIGEGQPILEVAAKGCAATGIAKWAIFRRHGAPVEPVEWVELWRLSEILLSGFLFK